MKKRLNQLLAPRRRAAQPASHKEDPVSKAIRDPQTFDHPDRIETMHMQCETCGPIFEFFALWKDKLCADPYSDSVDVGMAFSFRDSKCSTCQSIVTMALLKFFQEDVSLQMKATPDGFVLKPAFSTSVLVHASADPLSENPSVNFLRSALVNPADLHYNIGSDPWIDLSILRKWTYLCDTMPGHDISCGLENNRNPQTDSIPITLIDLELMCLVDVSPDHDDVRYVALSYVWGRLENIIHADMSNVKALHKPGAIGAKDKWSRIPRTVRDAILLVKNLGLRYLWVDLLCITQDDPNKSVMLSQMSTIYSASYFTVVVIDGTTANAGIPGIGEIPRKHVRQFTRFTTEGELFRIARDRYDFIENDASPWHSRAWTYQERALSRRNLVFRDQTVYWECRSTICPEELENPRSGFFALDGAKGLLLPNGCNLRPHEAYPGFALSPFRSPDLERCFNYVSGYTARQLSYQSDALDAFAAALTTFESGFQNDTFFGLPEYHFDRALFWVGKNSLERRPEFPSWSWLGWKGSVRLFSQSGEHTLLTDSSEEFYIPLVTWYKQERVESGSEGKHAIGNVAHEWGLTWEQRLKEGVDHAASRELHSLGWTRIYNGVPGYVHKSLPNVRFSRPFPVELNKTSARGRGSPPERRYEQWLSCKADTCVLQMGSKVRAGLNAHHIFDKHPGHRVGILIPTTTETRQCHVWQDVRLVAVSRVTNDCYPSTFRMNLTELQCGYNVLWIEKEGEFWCRKGIGRVWENDWEQQALDSMHVCLA